MGFLLPGHCDVTLHGKGKTSIQLRILRWADISDYLGEPGIITRVLMREGRRVRVRGSLRMLSTVFKGGGSGPEPQNISGL